MASEYESSSPEDQYRANGSFWRLVFDVVLVVFNLTYIVFYAILLFFSYGFGWFLYGLIVFCRILIVLCKTSIGVLNDLNVRISMIPNVRITMLFAVAVLDIGIIRNNWTFEKSGLTFEFPVERSNFRSKVKNLEKR